MAVLFSATVLLSGACGDVSSETAPPPSPANSENYFGDTAFVGRTVTVKGQVSRILTSTSFVLAGARYGDDTLLVINAGHLDTRQGTMAQVSGNVQKFDYAVYRDEYALDARPEAYAEFNGERFLVAMEPTAATTEPDPRAR
ncbi:hypothetical protein [Paractinoplanes hotanensis]|uniref:Lipoprotein n=1 Tax=Paractinoplanes hotanensis TaxID=2906497 RepID=A0ABT0XYP5_9ACTN|nr:hypothetical protein [Actinoplanes hotanensis]MCM4078899.1 hypothetical protein [Actinoplanes hotanensis]